MKAYLFHIFAACAGFLLVCNPAYAHHGGSMYDMNRLTRVKGTVTEYDWENPHVIIHADVKDEKGDMQKWSVETRGGPNVLAKAGWTQSTIKVGERITLVGHPNKNGSPNMRLQKVIFANGMELYPKSD
jgi:Family of unknown function (DUF6152)